ncbi:hypothetical protein VKT23_007503 [Stygiomarasmius scandens]|uniref:Transmembrane protein n=1 Tax=Marasmiellus scandens TaxID=2682957 RepID=A0ABR1JMV5_9AGAR
MTWNAMDTALIVALASFQLLTLFVASSKDMLLDFDILPVPILNLALLGMTILTIVFETVTVFQCLVFLYMRDLYSIFIILPMYSAIAFVSAAASRPWRTSLIGGTRQIIYMAAPFVPLFAVFVLGPYLIRRFLHSNRIQTLLAALAFFLVYLYVSFFHFPTSSQSFSDFTSTLFALLSWTSSKSSSDPSLPPHAHSPSSKFASYTVSTTLSLHIPLNTTSQREILVSLTRLASLVLAGGTLVVLGFVCLKGLREWHAEKRRCCFNFNLRRRGRKARERNADVELAELG